MVTETIAPDDFVSIHEKLTGFTDRYREEAGISNMSHSALYDDRNPLCDYGLTWYPAEPRRRGLLVGYAILGKANHVKFRDIHNVFIGGFADGSDEMDAALRQYPVTNLSGHQPNLLAALSGLSRSVALARRPGNNLKDMFKGSHIIAARSIAPLILGRSPEGWNKPLVELAQMAMNPHFVFAINKAMIEAGFPREFTDDYNDRSQADSIAARNAEVPEDGGYHSRWDMAAGGDQDVYKKRDKDGIWVPVDKKDRDEDGVVAVMHRVIPASSKFIIDMECGVQGVYTSVVRGQKPVMELGPIIPPNEVTMDTAPDIARKQAKFRRDHGEKNVRYAEDLDEN
jgi:hypothetical protein